MGLEGELDELDPPSVADFTRSFDRVPSGFDPRLLELVIFSPGRFVCTEAPRPAPSFWRSLQPWVIALCP